MGVENKSFVDKALDAGQGLNFITLAAGGGALILGTAFGIVPLAALGAGAVSADVAGIIAVEEIKDRRKNSA